ncbi:MAG: response regulator [Candidatus Rokubacteria bacterium]|nr:response regulator [Candidatus Rokubacteria bacterium]
MTGAAGSSSGSPASHVDVLRVLVVDDNAPILRFLDSAITAEGCLVSTAGAAEQALDLLSDQPFDLVISDIKMPGLSGLDLLRAVKGRQPATPVVLITGVPSVNSAVFGLRHGAYDYLPKPFSVKEVQQLIQRLRRDRLQGDKLIGLPSGLTEELHRRQFGVEVLCRIGELALQGLEPKAFLESVLGYTIQSLGSDAALILLRDEDGNFRSSEQGHPALVKQLLSFLHAAFEDLVRTGGMETLALTKPEHSFSAIAALIPGVGRSMGILCLGRDAQTGAFLPDEKELLLGYAQTTALALQKILLRENVEKNLVNTIASFVTALESKDPYLKGHSTRVSMYAGELATVMGLPESDVLVICRAGMLHDLGKLVVMDSILRKTGELTTEEYLLIKSHPVIGDKILSPLRFLAPEAQVVRHHHERYDGAGYPDGLGGEQIPPFARVVTVADAFDAMTSDRPYRTALPFDVAFTEIVRGAGTQFDPAAVQAFATIPRNRLMEISQCFNISLPAVEIR